MSASKHRYFSLEGVLKDMPTALVLIEVNTGTVLYANAAAERHRSAFEPGEEVTAFTEDGERMPGEALPHATAARGIPIDHLVIEYRSERGSVWLLFHAHVMEAGKVAVLTFDDVSALHQTQAQLHDALVARDELVSMASHELRSPIGALALAVEQICRKSRAHGLDDVVKLTSLSQRQIHRLKVLVGNLLDVSRLRAGRFELDREPCKLAEVIRDSCDALRDQAQAQKTPFDVDITTDGDGSWDAARMEQLLANLVTNALKYGGGKPVRVKLHAVAGDHVTLSVEDEGPGIPAEQLARIFEPFQHASEQLKARSLGLGLYLVHEIVTAHRGSIAVSSDPGRTCFAITLPRRAAP